MRGDSLSALTGRLPLLAGLLLTYVLTVFLAKKHKEGLSFRSRWRFHELGLVFVLVGMASVILLASIESWLRGRGFRLAGQSIYGSYLIAPLLLYGYARLRKTDYLRLMDVYALGAVPALTLARLNCIFSGCCQGRPIPGTTLSWPTREAEILFDVVLFIVLYRKLRERRQDGLVFPTGMVMYGVFRFLLEFFRQSSDGTILDLSHLWSLVSITIGLSILYTLRDKAKKTRETSKMKKAG